MLGMGASQNSLDWQQGLLLAMVGVFAAFLVFRPIPHGIHPAPTKPPLVPAGPPPVASPPPASANAPPPPLPAAPSPQTAATKPAPQAIVGIDVSHFQGDVAWATVAQSGVQFAYAKATDGITFTDPRFGANLSGARAAGLKVGAYHFFEPGDDPVKQAEHFLSVAKTQSGDLPPVLDLEVSPTGSDSPLAQTALAWLQHVEKSTGCKPIIYASPAFFNAHLGDGFDGYRLYLADYSRTPVLPNAAGPMVLWQHSQTGSVQGVHGHVDLDTYMTPGDDLSDLVCP